MPEIKLDMNIASRKAQIIYFSHGGGPLPILGDELHKSMIEFMKKLPENLHKPDAILVISAHWEEKVPTLLGAQSPSMFYDYYGFPDEAYKITYPAPGNPGLANTITSLLKRHGFKPEIDMQRGFDHGLFIPLIMMYPNADIPAIQLSLISGLDPAEHIKLGKSLQQLMKENILIIGSGFSFHNLGAFFNRHTKDDISSNDRFQNWLIDICTGELSSSSREEQLINWFKAPYARYCHPREEHLLPLHVCAGMADTNADLIFDDFIFGKRAVAFQW